jgi:hypothetical protein
MATILDKTLETIPADITKLLNTDKTNFVSPSNAGILRVILRWGSLRLYDKGDI